MTMDTANAAAVVVAAGQRPVGSDKHATDPADAPGHFVGLVEVANRQLLQRDRQIAAGTIQQMQLAQVLDRRLRPDRERHVDSGKLVLAEPAVVQHWRARVHEGPADDAGQNKATEM